MWMIPVPGFFPTTARAGNRPGLPVILKNLSVNTLAGFFMTSLKVSDTIFTISLDFYKLSLYICTIYVPSYLFRIFMKMASNPKKALILKTGKELFWKFGYKRVTVEEVCKEAGISKMTYYKHFNNKLELVKTIMDRILTDSLDKYKQIMSSDIPYPEKVVGMVQLKKDQIETMSSEFFRDYVQSGDPELISYLEQLSGETMQMFVDDFKKAQEEGNIRKDLKIEFIMYIMNKLVAWAYEDELIDMYDNPQDLVMELTNFLFYGILDREVHR
jgi:AcrR family transcriptional regulator